MAFHPWALALPNMFNFRQHSRALFIAAPSSAMLMGVEGLGFFAAEGHYGVLGQQWHGLSKLWDWFGVFSALILAPAWWARRAWWPKRHGVAWMILVVIGLHLVAFCVHIFNKAAFNMTMPVWVLCLLVLVVFVAWVDTRRIRRTKVRIVNDSAYVLTYAFCANLLVVVLTNVFLALDHGASGDFWGEIIIVTLWHLINCIVFVWVMVTAQRATTPRVSPPLVFGPMLVIDLFVDMIFINESIREPKFWALLTISVRIWIVRQTRGSP